MSPCSSTVGRFWEKYNFYTWSFKWNSELFSLEVIHWGGLMHKILNRIGYFSVTLPSGLVAGRCPVWVKDTRWAMHTDASELQILDRHTEACLHCSELLYMHVALSADGEFEIFQPVKDLDKFWLSGNRSDSLVCHLTSFYFYISGHRACKPLIFSFWWS